MADGDSASQRISANGVDFDGGDGIIGVGDGEMNLLPNYQNAEISYNKFFGYALDPAREPNKAEAFEVALGYNQSNGNRLIANIRHNLDEFPAVYKGHNGFGGTFECIMHLHGPNGKSANVLTAWIVLDGEDFPRLTSAYIDK